MKPASRLTVPEIVARKAAGQKLVVLTAYDHLWGELVDEAGVDMVLVGDSLGIVVQGRETTLPVTLEQMIYHAEMVVRAVRRALVVVDLPFLSFQLGPERAVEAAGQILKQTGCQAVKLESSLVQAETIAAMTSAGIPVMAHVGLRPQSVWNVGGYKVQRDGEQLLADAKAAADAGAFSIVLECIPSAEAARITRSIAVPTIGIGAGPECDGQVLVTPDILGLFERFKPRFVKRYANLRAQAINAIREFTSEVRDGRFPDQTHSFG